MNQKSEDLPEMPKLSQLISGLAAMEEEHTDFFREGIVFDHRAIMHLLIQE